MQILSRSTARIMGRGDAAKENAKLYRVTAPILKSPTLTSRAQAMERQGAPAETFAKQRDEKR